MDFRVPPAIRQQLFSDGKFLVTEITYESMTDLASWLLTNRKDDEKKTDFTILINSSGGSPEQVAYIASFLRTLSDEVVLTGVAFGECGSAALALLQCCNKRIAVKHCGFFIHHVTTTFKLSCRLKDVSHVLAELGEAGEIEDELVRLQCERSGLSVEAWNKLADRGEKRPGTPIFAGEAKKLGLVDEVVDQYPIF